MSEIKKKRKKKPMFTPKRFDIFPPDEGMLRRSRRVQIFDDENLVEKLKIFVQDFVPIRTALTKNARSGSIGQIVFVLETKA